MVLALAAVLAGQPLIVAGAEAAAREVRVKGAIANVRSGPSAMSALILKVRAGDVLRVIEESGEWLQVETADGRRGFILRSLTEAVVGSPSPATQAATAARPKPPASAPLQIEHREVGCIVQQQYAKLDACFAPSENLGRAQIHFRARDTDPWYGVELTRDGPCHSAFLPKPLKTTAEVQYYVDAVDRAFGEHQQPASSPSGAYRVRVVKDEGECGTLKRLASSVGRMAKPMVVAVAKTAAGGSVQGAAGSVLGATLAGFSTEGVVLASALGTSAAAVAAGSGTGTAGTAAGAGGATGTGGGIGMGTVAIVGGAVVAGGLALAVARGSDEPSCSAEDIVRASAGELTAVGSKTICGQFVPCGRLSYRACLEGVCTPNSCRVYYELSDSRQFSCGTCSGTGNVDTSFCVAAAQEVVNAACQ